MPFRLTIRNNIGNYNYKTDGHYLKRLYGQLFNP